MKRFLAKLPYHMTHASAVIIALMPFHAFLTVWVSSAVGQYTLLRLWKEILLMLLIIGAVTVFAVDAKLRRAARAEKLFNLMVIYVLLILITGGVSLILDEVSLKAYAYGVVSDTRYLVFFAITWLCTHYGDFLVRTWKRLLLIPATVVGGFAALQYMLLPADFLRHFGYGTDTILPSITVDQKEAYRRIQSTLRGPNPLGAYLVIVLSALGACLLRSRKNRWMLLALYVLSGVALVFTYSRSAWVGVFVSTVCLLWITLASRRTRKLLSIAVVSATVTFGVVGFILRDNDSFQNIIFHTNENSLSSESSNAGRKNAMQDALADIIREPWGRGTGTAGPASVYNDGQVRLSENYYLQIGQEAGIAGLGLFVAVNVLVAVRLWRRRTDTLAIVLLASFIGIMVINMLSHAWADDTLAYIWWGLAGAAIALPVTHTKPDGNFRLTL